MPSDPDPSSGTGRGLMVVAAVATSCAILVSAVVEWTRPRQLAVAQLDHLRDVAIGAGLAEPSAALSEQEWMDAVTQLEPRVVDLKSDRYSEDLEPAIVMEAGDDAYEKLPIPPVADIAGLKEVPRYHVVFWRGAGRADAQLILPVSGQGMWSMIKGYVAVQSDLATLERLHISEHGETPGVGDRIEDPAWLGQWRGKKVSDLGWTLRLKNQNSAGAKQYEFDAISGATVTADAVSEMLRFWLGDQGYGPLLAHLRRTL